MTPFQKSALEWLDKINPLVKECSLDLAELEAILDSRFDDETFRPEDVDLYKEHLNMPALLFAFYTLKSPKGTFEKIPTILDNKEACSSADIFRYIVLLKGHIEV